MGEIVQLPKRMKWFKKVSRLREIPDTVADPQLRAVLTALCENDNHIARVAKLSLMEMHQRLDTLEGIVFAQSVLLADLRGKPLTPKQRAKISSVLKRKGKGSSGLE